MPMEGDFMGKKLTVRITEAGKHYMKCRLVDSAGASRPEGVPQPLKLGQLSGAGDLYPTEEVGKGGRHHPLLVISIFVLVTSLLLRLYYSLGSSYAIAR